LFIFVEYRGTVRNGLYLLNIEVLYEMVFFFGIYYH